MVWCLCSNLIHGPRDLLKIYAALRDMKRIILSGWLRRLGGGGEGRVLASEP
jgi:hypothetical protein